VGLGYAWQKKHGGFGAGQGAGMAASTLATELSKRGVEAGGLAKLLEPDDAIEEFAERAAGSASSPSDKANAIVTALQARRSAQAFVPWSLSEPRAEPPMTAAETLAAITKNGARKELYPLEVAALAVSALRTLDVSAQLAEVTALGDERTPPDPSGRFGYFVVALPAAQKDQPAQFFDAYGGRKALQPKSPMLLSDVEAVGAALSLRASDRLADNEDPAEALKDADAAVKLLPSSASVRTARGTVLLASAASDLGSAELQAAAQLAPDAPRRNNLAMLYLAMGDGDRAVRELSQALSEQPDFALGHLTLAAVHLAQGERDQARAELEKADALSPGLPGAQLTWAQYYASSGNVAEAIASAQRAVDARPKDPQSRLLLAGLYRQAARYDAMREQARKVLELTPAALQPRMRELIGRLLGPTALQVDAEPEEAPSAGGVAAAPEPGALPEPQHLELGDGNGSSGSRLRLLDDSAPSTGSLKGSDGAPKLRLKEPGTGLTLPK
jgi:tetratricopeptide (TPR) repeat protein